MYREIIFQTLFGVERVVLGDKTVHDETLTTQKLTIFTKGIMYEITLHLENDPFINVNDSQNE